MNNRRKFAIAYLYLVGVTGFSLLTLWLGRRFMITASLSVLVSAGIYWSICELTMGRKDQ